MPTLKAIHLLATGGTGGIETLCKNIGSYGGEKIQHEFFILWEGGRTADEMKQLKIPVQVCAASRKSLIAPFFKLYHLMKQKKIQIVVVHHEAPLLWLYATALKRLIPGLKVYIYAHANFEDMIKVKKKKGLALRKKCFHIAAKAADGIIGISQSVADSIPAPEQKITVIYNGIPTRNFAGKQTPLAGRKLQLLFAGRMVEEKGVQLLLEALALWKTSRAYECHLLGEGPYLTQLKQQCQKLGLENRVFFQGVQTNVPQWMSRSDLFIHPAIWKEGFGITLVEAMASGNLCIAFAQGAIPEIIEDQKNGYLVKETSAQALADQLQNLEAVMDQPEKLQEQRMQARKRAEQFDIKNMTDRLEQLLGAGL